MEDSPLACARHGGFWNAQFLENPSQGAHIGKPELKEIQANEGCKSQPPLRDK
jgi:hypothetical protein